MKVEGRSWPALTGKYLKIYEEAGLSANKSFTEPEDHVATE